MTQHLPDDLFRQGAEDGSHEAGEEPAGSRVLKRSSVKTVPFAPSGISPRMLAGILVIALLLAFSAGRLMFFRSDARPVVTVSAAPTPSTVPSATPSADGVAYSGPVVISPALTAEGTCRQGPTRYTADLLLDEDPSTLWRCLGDGKGERITFTFSGSRPLVGVRVVNGNTAWEDRYLLERRLLSLRWDFDDGSYFVQGLAANNRNPQEVRFPQLQATGVSLTVLEATAPGEDSEAADAVSIGAVEFLTPA